MNCVKLLGWTWGGPAAQQCHTLGALPERRLSELSYEEGLWAAGGKRNVSESNRQIVGWLVSRLVSGLVRTNE